MSAANSKSGDSIRIEKLGQGEPRHVIVGSVHGDEPCGKNAIERFLETGIEVEKPVKFIIANEEALEEDTRFLDTDLNRSFPGDSESDSHEERLAARISEHLEGKVLDIHSTRSYPRPFATLTYMNEGTYELARATGAENIVHFPEESGTLHEQVDEGLVIEVGYQGTEGASERAYGMLLNFLAARGIIDGEYELSDPAILRYYETVEGRGYEFTGENFEPVRKGEVYARRGEEELRAEEDFYPVLMSTSGYEDKLGFKAKKVELEEAI
ncbi:MAG: succinylglutamate desuccinylase/aspartoacylase family protein [Candidatus Nanohaloarchaea archaeon]